MSASAAIVVTEKPSTAIAEFKPFEASLAEYKARYVNVVYDMTDKKQEKQARSDRLAIGKVVAELDRVHATVKAPLLEQVKLLDGERKRIKDDLQTVQGGIKKQIEEHEAKIQAIEDALIARVDAISAMTVFESDPSSDDVMKRILQLKKIVVDDTFAHYQTKAVFAHQEADLALAALYDKVTQAEADAEELARLRAESEERARKDREAQIAAEAVAKATREAEEAAAKAKLESEAAIERERQAALKAEQDAAAAVERERLAKEEAERVVRETAERAKKQAQEAAERAEREKAEAVAKAEAAAKTEAERVERDRLAAIEADRVATEKREANKRHCAKINNAAVDALIRECELTAVDAKAVITAIAQGKVPAASIAY